MGMANEKRLIPLDEALKATHSEIYWTESQQAAVRSFLVKQPKVDAVEVVRCKDCKHCKVCYPEKQIDKEATQGWFCKEHKSYRKPDDFCSYGERREGE